MINKLTPIIIAVGLAATPAFSQNMSAQGNAELSVNAAGSFEMAQIRSYLDVLAQLNAQGYSIESVKKTFLGRARIEARNEMHLREIVVSRSTGEIMSDVLLQVFAQGESAQDIPTVGEENNANNGSLGLTVDTNISIGINSGAGGGNASGGGIAGISIGLGN